MKYLMVFKNPHDAYKELKIPLNTSDDRTAACFINAITDVLYTSHEKSIAMQQKQIKLFRLEEVDLHAT